MHKIHLPRLGQTMERGTILRWFKAEGDSYEIGESLYEVETEKVVNDIEAKLPGTLCRVLVSENEELPVGTLLAIVADPGEQPSEEDVLSYTDLFLEALVSAVGEQPLANAAFGDDEIVVYKDLNVSVAVATEAGLLVPVLHKAQEMSLGERAVALRELGERARTGKLASADFEGGTIALSNLGMHGVEGGTPLVTAPQSAVVFAGAMVERPWVVDGEVLPRPTITISAGFDHRVLDGVSAARFTTAFRRNLEGSP